MFRRVIYFQQITFWQSPEFDTRWLRQCRVDEQCLSRLRPQAAEHAGVARERLVFRPLYLPADPPNTVSINLPVGVLGAHVAVEKNGVTLCPSINGSARCSLSVESPSSAKAGHRDNVIHDAANRSESQRSIAASRAFDNGAPLISIVAKASSISRRSSAANRRSAALRLSSRCSILVPPGIGTI